MIDELNTFFLKNIGCDNVILQLNNLEDNRSLLTWDHNIKCSISTRPIFSNDQRSEFTVTHLNKLSQSINCFLKFNCFQFILNFRIYFFVSKHRCISLLQWVIGQHSYDSNHFSYWKNNNSFCVGREHDRTNAHDYTGKNSCAKGIKCFLLYHLSNVVPNEYLQPFASPIWVSFALFR